MSASIARCRAGFSVSARSLASSRPSASRARSPINSTRPGRDMPPSLALVALLVGKLVDASGHVTPNAVIVVDGERIVSVGTATPPANAAVIDLRRYTVVPGLIDAHTHMTYSWDRKPGTKPLGQPRRPAGVTTVLAGEN